MLRFSVRDLLLVTLVVGVVLGWWIDRERLRAKMQSEIDRANELVTKWNMAARAVGIILTDEDRTVTWDMESSQVTVLWPKKPDGFVGHRTFSVDPANAPLVYEIVDEN
jgi:hypothetical protein